LERGFPGDSPAPRWGMRQRLRPAMIGRADLRVSRPCRNGHLGGAAASPDQSNQTSWNRESREPCETAQHRRCDLFVEGPKGHHASAPGPKARNVIGCQTTKISQGPKARNVIARPNGPGWQTTKIFRGVKGRPNIHAADGPALQTGRRWGGTGSRAFSPGCHRSGFEPWIVSLLWLVSSGALRVADHPLLMEPAYQSIPNSDLITLSNGGEVE
jgi:hypothetical protein